VNYTDSKKDWTRSIVNEDIVTAVWDTSGERHFVIIKDIITGKSRIDAYDDEKGIYVSEMLPEGKFTKYIADKNNLYVISGGGIYKFDDKLSIDRKIETVETEHVIDFRITADTIYYISEKKLYTLEK
jgi:hypothetical protein